MIGRTKPRPSIKKLFSLLGWTRSSSVLLACFFLVCGLIVYIWWPLAQAAFTYVDWKGPWWLYMDWLLLGIFLFMSITILSQADLRRDALIVFVGMIGGLVIESWGTQTNIWHYYTAERPPLWIIPAWPIASLSIDRLTRFLNWSINRISIKSNRMDKLFRPIYWAVFIGFYILMLSFVAPTFDKSFTILALLLVAFLTLTPTDYRYATLTFLAGSGLGYFLELWGTTRQCWTYYTAQMPPFFAVLAHGLAAVAFWRAGLMVKLVWSKFAGPVLRRVGIANWLNKIIKVG